MTTNNKITRSSRPALRLSAAACVIGFPALANATTITGRLAFITSEFTDATSGDISTYNSFVNTIAGLNPALNGITFAAIVSTDSVSAADNVACTGDCATAPIYLVDGTEVAASTADLFAGNFLDLSGPFGLDEDESGEAGAIYAWTGSNSDGSIATGDAMGDSQVEYVFSGGLSPFTEGSPDSGLPIYAISTGEVTFDLPTPEPASLSLLLFGSLGTGLVRRLRRNRRGRG